MKLVLGLTFLLMSTMAFSIPDFNFTCKTYDNYPKVIATVRLQFRPCQTPTPPVPCTDESGTLSVETRDQHDYTDEFHDKVRVILGRDYGITFVKSHPDDSNGDRVYQLDTYFDLIRNEGKAPGKLKLWLTHSHFTTPILYDVMCSKDAR